ELGERVAVQVRGEIGAHHVPALLAHVLRAPLGVERRHLVGQDPDLLRREQAREEQIAVAVELLKLLGREFHGRPPSTSINPCPPEQTPYARFSMRWARISPSLPRRPSLRSPPGRVRCSPRRSIRSPIPATRGCCSGA